MMGTLLLFGAQILIHLTSKITGCMQYTSPT